MMINSIASGYELDESEHELLKTDAQKRRYAKIAIENEYDIITFSMIKAVDVETQKEYLNNNTIDDLLYNSRNTRYEIMEYIIKLYGYSLPEKYQGDDYIENVIDDYYGNSNNDGLSMSFINDVIGNGFVDLYEINYSINDMDSVINKELLNVLEKDAIEDNLIPDDVDINNFDDMIEYIEDTDIEDKLRDAHRRASELAYYNDAYKTIKQAVDDFIYESEYVIILSSKGHIDDLGKKTRPLNLCF